MPAAWEISILETLGLLDGSHQEFAAGIADDRYAIWLGAGVSLKKLPGLNGVSEAILEHLRSKIDPGNPDCHFRSCLNNVLALVVLDKTQRAAINLSAPAATWEPIELIKQQLVNNYAVMLDQFPATEAPDYLVWEGVKVADRYANPATTPGSEHLGLAALIMEGVASDCASANWDDLIEKAVQIADGPNSSVLQVRVVPTDVQDNIRRARLYKFHGCAALAGQNEVVYRQRIVGRQSQIDGWAAKAENQVIAGKMLDLAVSKGTLMLGLSAQDANIQDVFVRARTQLPANFPAHPPAVVVSEDKVGVRQRNLLQNFYLADYPIQSAAIQEASLVRSFADALLPALWLHVICAKLNSFLDAAAANLSSDERDELMRGLQRLRDLGASFATVGDHEAFMRTSLSTLGRAIRLFHNGHTSTPTEGLYAPLTDTGVSRTLADPYLASTGLLELSLALAIIGHGEHQGYWTCTVPEASDPKSGVIEIEVLARRSQVFFAGSAHAAAQMFANGYVSDDDDAIVVHSFAPPDRAARRPTNAPGRTGKVHLRELSVSSIKAGTNSLDTIIGRFKMEAAL